MAASIDNRQYPGPLNGTVGRSFNVSPIRGCNFPANPAPLQLNHLDSSSDDDDEDEYENDKWKYLVHKGNSELESSIFDPRDDGTADGWIERNASLVRLTGKHPFNSEPPLTRLMHHGFITPVPIHYVRNHGYVPKGRWEDWTVEVCGLVKRPARFTMDQLVNEFPSREFPVTLVCAGNRRKEQNMVKQSIGFNWGSAAVSTSVWKGVPLRYVLKRCGIFTRTKGALHVCFEGAEDLPGGGGSKYGTSIKREFALDPARDIILAFMQNGERLAPDHGFPVRMIIPGFIGGRMVKWLKRIIVTPKESDNHYHYKDNRVLPSHVDAELANAEGVSVIAYHISSTSLFVCLSSILNSNLIILILLQWMNAAWWYKPEYIINELNINSVITTPCHEEVLPINSWTTQRPYFMRGYAYSG